MGRILNHIYCRWVRSHSVRTADSGLTVDIASFARINTCSSVDRVLVLENLGYSIKLICAHLVSPQIVQVENVCLPGFPSDNAHTLDVRASKYIRR